MKRHTEGGLTSKIADRLLATFDTRFSLKMRQNKQVFMRCLVLCLLYAAGNRAFAGEFAVLASGVRMYVDRHEADATRVRLYHGSDFLEVNASAVKGFEPDDSPKATPAPASAPAAPVTDVASGGATSLSPLQLADEAAEPGS